MSQIENPTTRVTELMNMIDLGPTQSIQFLFAKLQMAQSQICKAQAEDYMKQIENIQNEQKAVAEMIEEARKLQQDGKSGKGKGTKSVSMDKTTSGEGCCAMTKDLVDFMNERGLFYPNDDGDCILGQEEWDICLKSLTNYQEQIGNNTQTLMIYLQDFIGQYNSYQEGAMSAISSATQTLRSIAKGQ